MSTSSTVRSQILKLCSAYGPPDKTFITTRVEGASEVHTVRIKRAGASSRRFLVMAGDDGVPTRLEPITTSGRKRIGKALRRDARRDRDRDRDRDRKRSVKS